MEWTLDYRRETEWKEVFVWLPVAIETINAPANILDEKFTFVCFEKLEKRTIALPNNGTGTLYRRKGSTWDYVRPEKPTPPPGMVTAGKKRGKRT